jgi:hypothetical protein
MIIDKDILGHDGGGPGIAPWLYGGEDSRRVLTNAHTAGASRTTSQRSIQQCFQSSARFPRLYRTYRSRLDWVTSAGVARVTFGVLRP